MCIASKRVLLPVAIVAMSGFLFEASAADPVIAVKVAKAPDLAAGAADPAWAQAKAVTVALAGGANFKDGKTTATIKAVYSGDMFYMLIQYDDPTIAAFPTRSRPTAAGKSWSILRTRAGTTTSTMR